MTTRASGAWQVADFFVARMPALHLDALEHLGADAEAPGAPDDPPAAERDRVRSRAMLRELASRPDVREALFLASPGLAGRVDAWLLDAGSGQRRVERALLRYLSRMAGRTTPFGLFAGWSLGMVGGASTHLDLSRASRTSALDAGYLLELSRVLEDAPGMRERLRYHPNPTLYEAAGRIRYVESRGAVHDLVVVEPTVVLRAVLARAAAGARLDELVDQVAEIEPTVERPEAAKFVNELIDAQVLVSELVPLITGSDPADGMVHALEDVGAHAFALPLRDAQVELDRIDAQPPGVELDRYHRVSDALSPLPVAADPARLFRTDLRLDGDLRLGDGVIAELQRGIEVLSRVGGGIYVDGFADFRNAFTSRYGDREVPLLEALDDECGVGLRAGGGRPVPAPPLFDGFSSGERVAPTRPGPTPRDDVLARLVGEAQRARDPEVQLAASDLEQLARAQGEPTPIADAVAVMATVLAGSSEAVARGDFRLHLAGITGPSGATLLGRFCAGDAVLTEHVRRYLQAEQELQPDALLAEVVHRPTPRSGNVVSRPVLRQYEIPVIGRSGAPREDQIDLDDLVVAVRQGRVVLRSRRRGRVVVPRLGVAHDFRGPRNLGVYRFLAALQYQDAASAVRFVLGPLSDARYVPRLTAGRLVLSRARWNLTAADLAPLVTAPDRARFGALSAIREEFALPRWVAVADGDSVLPVDLDDVLLVDAAAAMLRRRSGVTLVEVFHGRDDVLARGPGGRYVHELVVPFLRTAAPHRPTRVVHPAEGARRFPPGSGWLYVKLYTGTIGDDVVLRDLVRPVVRDAMAAQEAVRWFFVRYGDPEWHLRLRLQGDPVRLLHGVLPRVLEAAAPHLASGLIWRAQVDTYEREVVRYGGARGIDLAEQVFAADSDAVLDLLDLPQDRWRACVQGFDALLRDAGLGLSARHRLVRDRRADALSAHGAPDALARRLGALYRRERPLVDRLLDGPDSADEAACAIFARRSETVRPLLAELGAVVAPNDVPGVLSSLLHMHANRLLGADVRRQELVVLDFLHRSYASRTARGIEL
ncbi:lantibiotic dehydratase [Cellulomonas fengjieae]|uniref:lantibiotic dehydratase n=1 Tax=Cellulomonas fengjieae TaxID=2819978 RepID=UPI001AAF9F8E|nr:lantibiotic dehydratase [Cellulomonas fengjieae]MBO3101301.1 lantibiotic dehydratase [Cellulomonas fengjieae]